MTDATRAVTPNGLGAALARLEVVSFVGHDGAGACTLVGAKVGDVVFSVTGVASADAGDQSALFEATITTVDEIQQSSESNLSTKVYTALVYHVIT